MRSCGVLLVLMVLASAPVAAQPYRWTDDKGRVHFSDTPPSTRKPAPRVPAPEKAAPAPSAPAAQAEAPVPFEVSRILKDFPVTLYTAPAAICGQPCENARTVLNRRGIPFTEIQVWSPETLEKLKAATNGEMVPSILVGRSTMGGFDAPRYDALLDSAGYPKTGAVPARKQSAPPPPEGYQPPPVAEPARAQPEQPAAKSGPYDTSGLRSTEKPRAPQYDPSMYNLPDQTRPPGRYATPEAK